MNLLLMLDRLGFFNLKNNTWQQIANNINGESSSDYFGNSTAMNSSGGSFCYRSLL